MKNKSILLTLLIVITVLFVFTSCNNNSERVQSNSNFPTSFSISPDKGEVGRIITIDLKGGNVDSTASSYNVKLGDTPIDIISDSADVLKFQVPKGISPGTYMVTVSGEKKPGNCRSNSQLCLIIPLASIMCCCLELMDFSLEK